MKISSLKAEQKQAVVGVLNGKDVMAILPTGFGKSVIFELFTLVKMQEDELTSLVTVSPLTSIMEDQIKDFEDLGISEVKLSCDEKTLEEIAGGKYRVIFGSAEAVLDERFRKVLKDYRTSRVEMCMQPCKNPHDFIWAGLFKARLS